MHDARRTTVLGSVVLWAGLLFPAGAPAALTPEQILRRALEVNAGVKDYTAQVQVRASFGGTPLEIPPLTLYFKRPDKVRIKGLSPGIVPSDMLTFGQLAKRIEEETKILLAGTKMADGIPMHTVKLKPKTGDERVLVTVNGKRWTIERLEVYRGQEVRMRLEWEHSLIDGRYWMPRTIRTALTEPAPGNTPGPELTVVLSGYKINTGLPDSVFTETGQ